MNSHSEDGSEIVGFTEYNPNVTKVEHGALHNHDESRMPWKLQIAAMIQAANISLTPEECVRKAKCLMYLCEFEK